MLVGTVAERGRPGVCSSAIARILIGGICVFTASKLSSTSA